MNLHIDTTSNQQTIVKLDSKIYKKTYSSPRSQNLLLLISKSLKQQNKSLKDITKISVNPGPGAFTSLRVGVAVANALSFALNITVNNNLPGIPIIPSYGKPPNIT